LPIISTRNSSSPYVVDIYTFRYDKEEQSAILNYESGVINY